MKVFISWSGDVSREVASLLAEWIPDVLQGVDCWFSADDIDKGTLWFNQIDGTLKDNNIGIVCLTAENLAAPWILFEAGALFKGLSQARVCPLLIGGLAATEIRAPLSHFNLTIPTREDMLKLLKTINQYNSLPLDPERLEKSFGVWWPKFDAKYTEITTKAPAAVEQPRKMEDILEEVLDGIRQIQRTMPTNSIGQPTRASLADLIRGPAVSVTQEVNGTPSDDYNKGILKIDVLRSTLLATGSGKFSPVMQSIPAFTCELLEAPENAKDMVRFTFGSGSNFDFNIHLMSKDRREPIPTGEYVFEYIATTLV